MRKDEEGKGKKRREGWKTNRQADRKNERTNKSVNAGGPIRSRQCGALESRYFLPLCVSLRGNKQPCLTTVPPKRRMCFFCSFVHSFVHPSFLPLQSRLRTTRKYKATDKRRLSEISALTAHRHAAGQHGRPRLPAFASVAPGPLCLPLCTVQ